jgi:hypothetical protein
METNFTFRTKKIVELQEEISVLKEKGGSSVTKHHQTYYSSRSSLEDRNKVLLEENATLCSENNQINAKLEVSQCFVAGLP